MKILRNGVVHVIENLHLGEGTYRVLDIFY